MLPSPRVHCDLAQPAGDLRPRRLRPAVMIPRRYWALADQLVLFPKRKRRHRALSDFLCNSADRGNWCFAFFSRHRSGGGRGGQTKPRIPRVRWCFTLLRTLRQVSTISSDSILVTPIPWHQTDFALDLLFPLVVFPLRSIGTWIRTPTPSLELRGNWCWWAGGRASASPACLRVFTAHGYYSLFLWRAQLAHARREAADSRTLTFC